jgi:hypothetical protein
VDHQKRLSYAKEQRVKMVYDEVVPNLFF